MLSYLTISLFDSPAQALVNTVNTMGVMGKGIAAVFKQLYPDMYQRYRRLCDDGKLDIGMLYIYRTPSRVIVNFPTKKHWRQPSQPEYIEAGLQKFVEHYTDYGIASVSFPQLGCGHGELDWETQVRPLMERYLTDLPIPVYIHLYQPPPDFVPERLDADYSRQVQMERQRISSDQLWQDLRTLIGESYSLTLFGPIVNIDDKRLIFTSMTEDTNSVILYREDLENTWNVLRVRGTIRESDVAQTTDRDSAVMWLFELLQRLEYIRPVTLRTKGRQERGLLYAPRLEPRSMQQAEIIL